MIHEKRFLKVLDSPHVSEKASKIIEKNNTIVFKVFKNTTKAEIKKAVHNLFKVEVNYVHTILVKGKRKRHRQNIGRRNNWKKAYIKLKKGQSLDFMDNSGYSWEGERNGHG